MKNGKNGMKWSNLEPFQLMLKKMGSKLALQRPQFANNAEFQHHSARSRVFAKFILFWLFWSPRSTHSIKRPFSFIPSTYNIQREPLKDWEGRTLEILRSPRGEQRSSKLSIVLIKEEQIPTQLWRSNLGFVLKFFMIFFEFYVFRFMTMRG